MKEPSNTTTSWHAELEKIIGLGERSLRKTYYPELMQKLNELERFRALIDESNDCIFLIQASSLTFVDVNESACRQIGSPTGKLGSDSGVKKCSTRIVSPSTTPMWALRSNSTI